MCHGKYVTHLFLFKGNYGLDWRNRAGLILKADALLSSAGIPLCSAPYFMVQQRKGRSDSSMLLESEAGIGTPGEVRRSMHLSLGCHMTVQDSSFREELRAEALDL